MSKDLTEEILDDAIKEIEKAKWHRYTYVFHPKDLEILRKAGFFNENINKKPKSKK